MALPGGNLTGLVLLESSIAGKWLSMLKEVAPRFQRAALVGNPKTSPYDYFLRTTQAAALVLGIEVVSNRVENAADIESSIESFAREPDGGLVVVPDATMTRYRGALISLAARHRLPAVYPEPFYVTEGGLMSDGIADLSRRANCSTKDALFRTACPDRARDAFKSPADARDNCSNILTRVASARPSTISHAAKFWARWRAIGSASLPQIAVARSFSAAEIAGSLNISAARPCRSAFRRTRVFPQAVRGPRTQRIGWNLL